MFLRLRNVIRVLSYTSNGFNCKFYGRSVKIDLKVNIRIDLISSNISDISNTFPHIIIQYTPTYSLVKIFTPQYIIYFHILCLLTLVLIKLENFNNFSILYTKIFKF